MGSYSEQIAKLNGGNGTVKYVVSRDSELAEQPRVSLPANFSGDVQAALEYVKKKQEVLKKLDNHHYELRYHIIDNSSDIEEVLTAKEKIEQLPNFVSWEYENYKVKI